MCGEYLKLTAVIGICSDKLRCHINTLIQIQPPVAVNHSSYTYMIFVSAKGLWDRAYSSLYTGNVKGQNSLLLRYAELSALKVNELLGSSHITQAEFFIFYRTQYLLSVRIQQGKEETMSLEILWSSSTKYAMRMRRKHTGLPSLVLQIPLDSEIDLVQRLALQQLAVVHDLVSQESQDQDCHPQNLPPKFYYRPFRR